VISHRSVSKSFSVLTFSNVVGPSSYSKTLEQKVQLMQKYFFCILGDISFSLFPQNVALLFNLPQLQLVSMCSKSIYHTFTFATTSSFYYHREENVETIACEKSYGLMVSPIIIDMLRKVEFIRHRATSM